MTSPVMFCAICVSLHADQPWEAQPAVTQVGPLPSCGAHVDAALERLGYATAGQTADVVTFLENVDPAELQSQAAELVDDYGDGAVGQAYLAVLVKGAKELAAVT